MPVYCFKCETCGERAEVSRPMRDSGSPEECPCGKTMERDFATEHSSVRGDYNKPIVSTSMAFDATDVPEHRRRHPGVELRVDEAGQTAYPILRNLSQKRKYLKARGWVDCNSFI